MISKVAVFQGTRTNSFVQNALLVVASSFIIALAAQFSIKIPFLSPVPFSLQPHAVLLLSALLGAKRAFLTVCLYLTEGLCGLPVFALGNSGLAVLLGPSAGYLYSYLLISFLTGKCFEKVPSADWTTRVSFFAFNNVLILFSGYLWLSVFIGVDKAWLLGVYPFLATDLLKTFVIASGIPTVQRFMKLLQSE